MLPKLNRLKKDREIERVFREGQGHKEGFLFFKLVKNGLRASRFAFVVGRKVAPKATIRNKIKRKLRQAVRVRLPEIKSGFDGVFVSQKGIEKESFEELTRIIDKILKKAKIL